MEENHTGVNITQVLLNAVDEWNLSSKTLALVSDNAANMVVAAKESKLSPFIRCFAHTFNLAVQRGLKVKHVSVLLAEIRRFFFLPQIISSSNYPGSKSKVAIISQS